MELHNDQVPGSEVWAVVIGDEFGDAIDWWITAETSSQDYRDTLAWYERHMAGLRAGEELNVTVSRWYVLLPRQRMDRGDVTDFVEAALADPDSEWAMRLDVKKFKTEEKVRPE